MPARVLWQRMFLLVSSSDLWRLFLAGGLGIVLLALLERWHD